MKNKSPWWLEEGTEDCPACGQTYVYQTEFRCVECDSAICPICVETTVSVTYVCAPCGETEELR